MILIGIGYRLLYALCVKIGKRRVSWGISFKRKIWICRDRSCWTWWSNGFICGTHTYSRLRQMIHEETILHTCKPFVSNPICKTPMILTLPYVFIKWLIPVMFVLWKVVQKLYRSYIFVMWLLYQLSFNVQFSFSRQ